MKTKNIVIGQRVDSKKVLRSKELRQDMTPEERILWGCLRRNQLGLHFRRQQIIEGWIVDFYCHPVGLVIEVDGSIHTEQKEHDLERDNILSQRGLQILRFSNEAIQKDLQSVLQAIRHACDLPPFPLREGRAGEG